MAQPFTIGVIISTNNNPRWLEKTLWGYALQSHKPDEVIIADDGSTNDTKKVVDSFRSLLYINHIWQEDKGFRKSEILNKAIVAATSDYLIFTDQDCIPRNDFVEVHYKNAREQCYISGGYFKLTMGVSLAITKNDIAQGDAFDINWLISKGQPISTKMTKLQNVDWFAKFMNFITPAEPTWNGCNSSGWRTDLLAVNGFNEDMQYGGQDREFGYRLQNNGIKPIQLRFSAICVHLDHKRPYKTKETLAFNRNVMLKTRKNRVIKTPNGIVKL